MANGAELATGGGGAQPRIAPGAPPQGVDPNMIVQVLQQLLPTVVDEAGFVDIKRLVAAWPQAAQQAGLEVPFETVMQMISQNPELLRDIVVQMGLAGISVDGQQISAEQLAGLGSGASGNPVQSQGAPTQQGGF